MEIIKERLCEKAVLTLTNKTVGQTNEINTFQVEENIVE